MITSVPLGDVLSSRETNHKEIVEQEAHVSSPSCCVPVFKEEQFSSVVQTVRLLCAFSKNLPPLFPPEKQNRKMHHAIIGFLSWKNLGVLDRSDLLKCWCETNNGIRI